MTAMQLPLFEPPTDWKVPEVFPDFRGSKYVGFDIETCDPDLQKYGPGFRRGTGFVCGISLANERGDKVYLPIAHDGDNQNLKRSTVVRYLREVLGDESSIKVGANVLYDLEGLKLDLDVDVRGKILDVLVNEPLLDENQRTYNLERLSQLYLGRGKEYGVLKEAVLTYCGKKGDVRKDLWRIPARYVGQYAEADAQLPVLIVQEQLKKIEEEGLQQIFDIETRLIPVLFYMRLKGVPVNTAKAELVMRQLQDREREAQRRLDDLVGMRINVWSGDDVAKAFRQQGESFPVTERHQNPSFEKKWLMDNPAPVAKLVVAVRSLNRMWSVFIKGTVLTHSYRGRVYCQFHQLRGDGGGTVTGRFSSSNPNLQQVPARDEELAPLVRGLFVPEEDCDWHCDDYSQIEPRLQVHYAALLNKPGARRAAEMYNSDPNTDFHQLTANLTGLPRKPAKSIHLGISYGMGIEALARHLGCSRDEAYRLRQQYNEYMPFLDAISQEVNNRAALVGYVKTILGRRRRFNSWEPAGKDENGERRWGRPVDTRERALEMYGPPIRRADTRKAFNGLIQGSAADVLKKAMVDIWDSGVLNEAHMHLTVHDELDLSVPKNRPEVGAEIVRLMSSAVKCQVPLKVDNEVGPSWGEVH